jgi:hypothetical protein
VSAKSAAVLGLGLGVLIASPLIGVGCVLLADLLTDWHHRHNGSRDWARRDWRKG